MTPEEREQFALYCKRASISHLMEMVTGQRFYGFNFTEQQWKELEKQLEDKFQRFSKKANEILNRPSAFARFIK